MQQQLTTRLILAFTLLIPALCRAEGNPFLGRWDFNITTPNGMRASWLGLMERNGKLGLWFQPTGGNVYQVKDFKLNGSHLTFTLPRGSGNRPAMTWEQIGRAACRGRVEISG